MTDILFSDDVVEFDWAAAKQFDSLYGTKGSAALAIPKQWTLPFALLPADVSETFQQITLTSAIVEKDLDRLRQLAGPTREVIVRSSVVRESIWDRGTYKSVTLNVDGADFRESLAQTCKEVIASAGEHPTGLMVQRYIRPLAQGEFGNLQRISKTRDHWELSTLGPAEQSSRVRLNSQRDTASDPTTPLAVRAGIARERFFAGVGAWLNNELLIGQSQRLNCEWITDNRHFYIVQIDEEDEDVQGVNPFQVRIPRSSRPTENNGRYLKMADTNALRCWDKLKVLEELWEADAVHKPMLFYICVGDLPSEHNETERKAFADDFRTLIGSSGIVVRTSVVAGADKLPNLPRTECLTPEQACDWCLNTAKLLQEHTDISKLAFIAHRFLASRASAWVRAEPGNPIVEINSLWGLPDALQYCPYDIWEVHLPTGTATGYPDYKSDMLVSKPDGAWEYVRVKNEVARSYSIGSTEAKELAVRSISIADRLGRACHIMWFIGCIDEVDQQYNLPWYWTEAHASDRNADRSNYQIVTVTDRQSLADFEAMGGHRTRQALALRPDDLELMRDLKFIDAVANAANSANVPIILYGSTLAHAYYQLRKADCTILTPSEKDHTRIRRNADFGKLVRDKIPNKIAARQEIEVSRQIPSTLRKGFLISKLVEEALEAREAGNVVQRIEELGDVYEVLLALAKTQSIDLQSVVTAAENKRARAGGFDDGLILFQTGISAGGQTFDVDRTVGELLAARTSIDTLEIPFSVFGFMELNSARSADFDEFGVSLEFTLKPDRIEIRIVRSNGQLFLPFEGDEFENV